MRKKEAARRRQFVRKCFELDHYRLKGYETGVTETVTPVLSLRSGFLGAKSDARYDCGQGAF